MVYFFFPDPCYEFVGLDWMLRESISTCHSCKKADIQVLEVAAGSNTTKLSTLITLKWVMARRCKRWSNAWVVAPVEFQPIHTTQYCKESPPRNWFQCFFNRQTSQVCKSNVVIQFANVICDFRCFADNMFKWMRVRSVIKDNASKDMFPAYRKKCIADKRTSFQYCMTFVVFGEKIEDHFFNFKGKYRRHENYCSDSSTTWFDIRGELEGVVHLITSTQSIYIAMIASTLYQLNIFWPKWGPPGPTITSIQHACMSFRIITVASCCILWCPTFFIFLSFFYTEKKYNYVVTSPIFRTRFIIRRTLGSG